MTVQTKPFQFLAKMLRNVVVFSMAVSLIWTTIGCGSSSLGDPSYPGKPSATVAQRSPDSRLSDGQYPVQQASYDDGDGGYEIALLNTKPGEPSMFRSENIQMARLTDEEIAAGGKSYLKVENGQPSLHLTEDFKIAYVHNVTETQTNPDTGEQRVVVVRQESNFWSPFAGALAGQALGSLLFRPQYYVPPMYQPGGVMMGYGGYGSSYGQAVSHYQERHNQPPAAVKNRQTFRTTGQLRSPAFGSTTTRSKSNTVKSNSNRSSGSGYGTSTLRRNNSSNQYRKSSGSFGSSRSSSGSVRPRSGFGSSRSSFRSGRRR